MDYRDVLRLIEEGEGFEVEFKRKVSTPEKIARALVAFANTKGGYILFGVDDDGSIIGVESEKSEVDLILHAGESLCLPRIEPLIDIVPFNGKDVIVAYVPESQDKPYYFTGEANGNGNGGNGHGYGHANGHGHSNGRGNGNGNGHGNGHGNGNGHGHPEESTRVYIRVNDKTVMASKEVVKILRDERPDAPPLRFELGENEKRLFRYLDENERITTKEFSRLVNISEQRATRILVSLVRAGVVRIHTLEKRDFFTLSYDLSRA
jgi:predicted HTH transcriptional regulator